MLFYVQYFPPIPNCDACCVFCTWTNSSTNACFKSLSTQFSSSNNTRSFIVLLRNHHNSHPRTLFWYHDTSALSSCLRRNKPLTNPLIPVLDRDLSVSLFAPNIILGSCLWSELAAAASFSSHALASAALRLRFAAVYGASSHGT